MWIAILSSIIILFILIVMLKSGMDIKARGCNSYNEWSRKCGHADFDGYGANSTWDWFDCVNCKRYREYRG